MKNCHGTCEDYAHELAAEAERKAHEAGFCRGVPTCGLCLDDWEEAEREELDRQGYYDSKGHWTT